MTGHANQTIHRVPHQEIRCRQKLPMTVNSSDPKTCCSLEKEELSKTQHTPNKQSNNVKSSHVMSNLVKSLSNLRNSFYHEQTARETRSNLRRNNVRSLSHTSALAGKENKKKLEWMLECVQMGKTLRQTTMRYMIYPSQNRT